jgi:predicted O-linked N-acetylglucosamine transferase (SPINDLY family)
VARLVRRTGGGMSDPRLGEAVAHHEAGRLAEAAALYQAILADRPEEPDALHLLGLVAHQVGQHATAQRLIAAAVERQPRHAAAFNNLGLVERALFRLDAAGDALRHALALDPNYADAHSNLASVLGEQQARDRAVSHARCALVLEPVQVDAWINLGNNAQSGGHYGAARRAFERGLRVAPGDARLLHNLGNVERALGRTREAVALYGAALAHRPDMAEAHSNLLLALNYDADTSCEELFAAYRAWEARFARPLYASITPHANMRDPERRLRVGYLSADFRTHPVAFNTEAVIAGHDRDRFEVYCYGEVRWVDEVTRRYEAFSDHWRNVFGLDDPTLAETIRTDRIDILVCIAGHTAGNRVRVCALKPAPVQCAFGDLTTSGLDTMDYWLTDGVMSPPGTHERFTESLVRLPVFEWHASPGDAPPPGDLPCESSGVVTFGSCNDPEKIGDRVIALWARVLQAVPGSRLALKYLDRFANPEIRARYLDRFAHCGIDAGRLVLLGRTPDRAGHLAAVGGLDVALDPFPYNGCTASFEALWMGVPVVTLKGERSLGRVGASQLHAIGLDELVAGDADAYVSLAAGLARDVARRRDLRARLRTRVQGSLLCDAAAQTRALERAYREMWRRWCSGAPRTDIDVTAGAERPPVAGPS